MGCATEIVGATALIATVEETAFVQTPRIRCALLIACLAALAAAHGCRLPAKAEPQRPDWADQPELVSAPGKFVTAVGAAAAPGDDETLTRRAEYGARSELGKAVDRYSTEALGQFVRLPESHVEPGSSDITDFCSAVAAETSNAILRQSLRHDTWQDPRDGSVYVHYRVPVSIVNARLIESLRFALERRNPFAPDSPDQAAERMDLLLGERLKALVAQSASAPPPAPEPGGQAPPKAPRNAPPEWLVYGRHDSYPADAYLICTGVGETAEAALENCRLDMAASLTARMRTRAAVAVAAEPAGGFAQDLRAADREGLRLASTDLGGASAAEHWYDDVTETHYVLGVLERQRAATAWRVLAQSLFRGAAEGLASGRNQHSADNYMAALQCFLGALASLPPALKWELAAAAVDRESDAGAADPDPAGMLPQARAALKDLMGDLTLRKVSGDGQWTTGGAGLRDALVVEVVASRRQRPIGDVPLRFRFVRGEGRLDEQVLTSQAGRASCFVQKVKRAEDGAGAIACTLDVQRVAGGESLADLAPPKVEFTFVTRAIRNTCLAVYVDERDPDGTPSRAGVIEPILTEALKQAGFRLLDSEQVRQQAVKFRLTGDSPEEDVARAFAGFDTGIRGQVFVLAAIGRATSAVDGSPTRQGVLQFARTMIELRVVDPGVEEDRKVLSVKADGADAFLNDKAEAVRRSRVKAAGVCAQRLADALANKFGGQ